MVEWKIVLLMCKQTNLAGIPHIPLKKDGDDGRVWTHAGQDSQGPVVESLKELQIAAR